MLKLLKQVLALRPRERVAPPPVTLPLPFPYLVVSGREALRERLSRLGGDCTPVLMGEPKDLELLCNILADSSETPEQVLAQANVLDVLEWLDQREQEDSVFFTAASGSWPSSPLAAIQMSMHLDGSSTRPKKSVILGLVPTARSWEVPAYANFGGWNACPESAAHVAVHRMWNARYRSEIASMSSDVIECTVAKPPATRDEAMFLAREQSIYCPDIVCQGVGTIENLAAALMGSESWYFWWD